MYLERKTDLEIAWTIYHSLKAVERYTVTLKNSLSSSTPYQTPQNGPASLVAQETNHSPEAVDKYTLDLDRVTCCLEKNLSVENASFVTGLSKKLIIEYKNLAQEIKNASTNDGFFDNIEDEIPF